MGDRCMNVGVYVCVIIILCCCACRDWMDVSDGNHKRSKEIVDLLLQKGADIVNKNNVNQSIGHTCLATVFCVLYIE